NSPLKFSDPSGFSDEETEKDGKPPTGDEKSGPPKEMKGSSTIENRTPQVRPIDPNPPQPSPEPAPTLPDPPAPPTPPSFSSIDDGSPSPPVGCGRDTTTEPSREPSGAGGPSPPANTTAARDAPPGAGFLATTSEVSAETGEAATAAEVLGESYLL